MNMRTQIISKFTLPTLALTLMFSTSALAATAVGTETVLKGQFGVNLHMDNCCNGNYADIFKVIRQLQYIGARRARDWATNDSVIDKWKYINSQTGIVFHAPIIQASPAGQRVALTRIQNGIKKYPGLIDVIEGTNEPDTSYPASQGASLVDSTNLQTQVYNVGKSLGVQVAQLSVGGNWFGPLWEGNYKNFGKPPADLGNAHSYMNVGVPPSIILKRIGELAGYSANGKPIDTTEFGTYQSPQQSDAVNSAFMHMAPFSSYLLGHVGLSVYALHDDMTGVVGFYKADGSKRAFADYWHYTTLLLSDPNGKKLPPKNINISFTNQRSPGVAPLGIKNVLMYKSDGSVWIAAYNEGLVNSADGFETIVFDKYYRFVKVIDARNGAMLNQFTNIKAMNLPLPVNRVFLISLAD